LWLGYGDWLSGPHAAEYADRRGALEAYQAARDHFERMGGQAKLAEANARILAMTGGVTPAPNAVSAAGAPNGTEGRRPQRRPRGAAELARRSQWARESFGLITGHPALLRLLEDVAKLARSTTAVLVLGESGTGKELIAHGIHRLSGRRGPFVPINCSALPREIIESELFGHVAGAFTGATREKPGLFEVCEGGTIFLDEIAEMPIELQTRLLRFLETGEVRRIGSNRNLAVNTRVVAATNRERAGLERGEGFRNDLYYRLAHAVVVLSPLRRRGEDVDLLVSHFLAEACGEEGKRVELAAAARARLCDYSWPGNVRQLRALVRRVVILAAPGHEVTESELELDEGGAPTTLLEELAQAERGRIMEALAQARGSRTEAAKALGMPRTTLIHKLRRFGIE
jgi:transcriptional regulator with PAS, ATPase and Fis domain